MVPLPGCDGRGHIPVDAEGTTMRMCRNLYIKSLKEHLGSDISLVQHVQESPLFKRGKLDRTGDNVFITGCSWWEFLPHLKLALACKGLVFSFKIVNDQQIKNVFVGNEHRKVRLYGEAFNNSLGDFIGDNVELAIIRLGFLGYKNIAAAGSLKEALLIRNSLGLATWIFEDTEYPWVHSRDMDVEYYIQNQFDQVCIKGSDSGITREPHVDVDALGEDPEVELETQPNPVMGDLSNPEFEIPGGGIYEPETETSDEYGELSVPGVSKR